MGDILVVIGVVECLRLFDKVPIRGLAARLALTQQRMNEIYAFQAAPEIPDPGLIYLPFRLQAPSHPPPPRPAPRSASYARVR